MAAFCNGVCTVFFRAAYPGLVRQVAPREQQESAFARLFGTESAMQVAGPGVGGLLAQARLGRRWACSSTPSASSSRPSASWRLSLPARRPCATTARPAAAPLGPRIREGIDYVRHDRFLRFFTVMGGV